MSRFFRDAHPGPGSYAGLALVLASIGCVLALTIAPGLFAGLFGDTGDLALLLR